MVSASARLVFVFAGLLASAMGWPQLRSELFAGGFSLPVAIVGHPYDPSLLFVVEQRSGTTGRIRVIQNGTVLTTPFLTVSPVSTGNEQGLLGLAFAPDYAASRYFYVNYTDAQGTTRIVRYQSSALNPLVADTATATPVLSVPQPYSNHNGGTLAFGEDLMLYIGLGDGGDGNDPQNRAQNTMELLGKMLRIDPRVDAFPGDPDRHYAVPPDNPFVGNGAALPEIWNLGLRNPWKYAFDPRFMLGYGAWLIADVGQGAREEINYEFPGQSGHNYGWRVWEGTLDTGLGGLSATQPNVTFPIHEYSHTTGRSITGGHVYRGIELGPEYFGRYFYGDFINSRIWSLLLDVDPIGRQVSVLANTEHSGALNASSNISTFGIDAAGELYFAKYSLGQIYRVRPLNRVWLAGVSAFESVILIGTLRHLVAVDGHACIVVPRPDSDRNGYANFRGGLSVHFKTDQMSTTSLNATARLWTSQSAGGIVRLFLRNWSTNQFVEVGSAAFGTSPTTASISGIPAAPYRRNDGMIEARLRTDVSAPDTSQRTTVHIDQARMTSF